MLFPFQIPGLQPGEEAEGLRWWSWLSSSGVQLLHGGGLWGFVVLHPDLPQQVAHHWRVGLLWQTVQSRNCQVTQLNTTTKDRTKSSSCLPTTTTIETRFKSSQIMSMVRQCTLKDPFLFFVNLCLNLTVWQTACYLLRRDGPLYNLASSLYSSSWEEGVYRLQETGHCHTFNPENFSNSGLQGQHYALLGLEVETCSLFARIVILFV